MVRPPSDGPVSGVRAAGADVVVVSAADGAVSAGGAGVTLGVAAAVAVSAVSVAGASKGVVSESPQANNSPMPTATTNSLRPAPRIRPASQIRIAGMIPYRSHEGPPPLVGLLGSSWRGMEPEGLDVAPFLGVHDPLPVVVEPAMAHLGDGVVAGVGHQLLFELVVTHPHGLIYGKLA